LHIYTAGRAEGGPSAFLVGLFLWSCIPYGISAVLARFTRTEIFALGAAAASLAMDGFTHYSVFIAPKGSTAALGLLFAPLWNLIAVGPIGALVAWTARRMAATGASEP
jgi:hypothetical protein